MASFKRLLINYVTALGELSLGVQHDTKCLFFDMEGREGVNFWSNLWYVIYEWPLTIQKRLKKIHLVLTIFGKKSVVGCGSHGKQMWRKSAKDSALISRWIKKVELFIFYYLLFFFIEKSSLLKNSAFADKLTHFLPLSVIFYFFYFFTTSLYWIEDDQLPTVLAPRPACVPQVSEFTRISDLHLMHHDS